MGSWQNLKDALSAQNLKTARQDRISVDHFTRANEIKDHINEHGEGDYSWSDYDAEVRAGAGFASGGVDDLGNALGFGDIDRVSVGTPTVGSGFTTNPGFDAAVGFGIGAHSTFNELESLAAHKQAAYEAKYGEFAGSVYDSAIEKKYAELRSEITGQPNEEEGLDDPNAENATDPESEGTAGDNCASNGGTDQT